MHFKFSTGDAKREFETWQMCHIERSRGGNRGIKKECVCLVVLYNKVISANQIGNLKKKMEGREEGGGEQWCHLYFY